MISRLFSTAHVKGQPYYLKTQRFYELARALITFGISACLFLTGYLQTGSRANLLTIVAVLGCLPASKSLVSAVMFFRYAGCEKNVVEEILPHTEELVNGFDFVFTASNASFVIPHLAVRDKSICVLAVDKDFPEQAFVRHLKEHLALDGEKEISVCVIRSLPTYLTKLEQMKALTEDPERSERILITLKSISL